MPHSREIHISDPGVSFRTMPVSLLEKQMLIRGIYCDFDKGIKNEPNIDLVTIRNPVPNLAVLVGGMIEAGVPILSEERQEYHPIIIVGGTGVNNPFPMDRFIDAFWIGDATKTAFDAIAEVKNVSAGRLQKLQLLHESGFYVPLLNSGEKPIRHKVLEPYLGIVVDNGIVTPGWPDSSKAKKAIVQVKSGCGMGCSFCIDGQNGNFSLTEGDFSQIAEEIIKTHPDIKSFRISFPSLSGKAFRKYISILKEIRNVHGNTFSIDIGSTIPSQFTKEVAKTLVELGETTMTFAPEVAVGEFDGVDLRKKHKSWFTDQILFSAIENGVTANMERLVLYHLTGFLGETVKHLDAYVNLVEQIKQLFPTLDVMISSGIVFPVIFTKMETAPQLSFKEGVERWSYLEKRLHSVGVKTSWLLEPSPEIRSSQYAVPANVSFTQALFHRAGRELGTALAEYWSGCKTIQQCMNLPVESLHTLLQAQGFNIDDFYKGKKVVTSNDFQIMTHQTVDN